MSGKDGGWILPAVIDPPDRICVCIPVPDEPAHRQAFWGALTELGYQHNWHRNAGHDAVPVSVLWYAIVAQAQAKFYSGVRTMCFSCEELAACLEPLLENLSNQIIQQMTFNQYGTPYPTGVPLPPEATAADVAPGSNPTCDYDVLWAQCWQAVTYADILITDALELAESATNDVELVQVITALPVIDELGGDAIAAYIEVLLEGITDNYAAQVTEAYLRDAACALFCLCQGDCVVNLDRLYKVYYDRMVAAFGTPASAFTTVTDLLLYVVDQEIEGSLIADALNMVIWGGGILSNQFLGDVGTTSLTALLQLAVNDANNDWETICDVCPPPALEAENVGVFGACGMGALSSVEFEDGVPFDIEASEDPSTPGTYNIALKLPSGNWNVTLNSITGTIVPPADLTNTAYAWHDETGTFHNVLWNAPATPADFGTHDTTFAIFAPWCDEAEWNAALGNEGPFTASFTVTAI